MASDNAPYMDMPTSCGICRQTYRDPCVLPCLHSYCRVCVYSRFADNKQGQLGCPQCNTQFEITRKDVEHLTPFFAAINLIPILTLKSNHRKNTLACENCDSQNRVKGRCADCKLFLCSFCVKAHRRIKTLKKHNILSVEDVKCAQPRDLAKQVRCRKHQDEALSLYCEKCAAMICRECTVLEHHGHEYVPIFSILTRERKQIGAAMEAIWEKIPQLEGVLGLTKGMFSRVEQQMERTFNKIDEFISMQIDMLEQVRTELKQKVDTVGRTKLMLLGAQEKRLALQLANAKGAAEFTKQTIRNTSDAEFLTLKPQMVSRLWELTEMPVEGRPCQDDGLDLRVSHSMSVCDFIPRIALIDSSTAIQSFCDCRFTGSEDDTVYTTFSDQTWEFTVTLRDHFRKQLIHGGNNVRASIIESPLGNTSTRNPSKHLVVTDHDNGTYTFHHRPPIPGVYHVTVKVDGYHVTGSPFEWNVARRIASRNLVFKSTSDEKLMRNSFDCTTLGDIIIEGSYAFAWKMQILKSDSKTRVEKTATLPGFKVGVYQIQNDDIKGGNKRLAVQTIGSCLGRVTSPCVTEAFPYSTTKAWYWCQGRIYTPHDDTALASSVPGVASRAACEPGITSRLASCEPGDVIALFLNPKQKSLTLVNCSSGEKDVIDNVHCPVSPMVTHLDKLNFNL